MPDTVAGLFRTRAEAEEALRKLKEAGFPSDQISLATPRKKPPGHYGRKVTVGIVAGAILGVVVGAVVAGIVPGMHPLIPGYTLATFLLAAFTGLAAGGLAGAMVGAASFGGEELFYEQEVESGRYLISVAGPRLEEAEQLMRSAGAFEAVPVEAPLDSGRPRPESG